MVNLLSAPRRNRKVHEIPFLAITLFVIFSHGPQLPHLRNRIQISIKPLPYTGEDLIRRPVRDQPIIFLRLRRQTEISQLRIMPVSHFPPSQRHIELRISALDVKHRQAERFTIRVHFLDEHHRTFATPLPAVCTFPAFAPFKRSIGTRRHDLIAGFRNQVMDRDNQTGSPVIRNALRGKETFYFIQHNILIWEFFFSMNEVL